MRIMMLDNEFPPLGGGTGVVNEHLLKEMSTYRSVEVDLVTSSRSRKDYEAEQFSERIRLHKVPVHNKNIHHASNRELLTYAWRGYRECLRLLGRKKYDISFAFSSVPAGAISFWLHRKTELPYLISLQGPDVPGFEERYNNLYPFLKPLLRTIWRNASVVTAISEEHRNLALKTMAELEISIVHNGVDTSEYHPFTENRSENLVRIICVGRLIERKGQDHLLKAVAQLTTSSDIPIHLTLVGTGDFESSLRELANKLGLQEVVSFTGFVPRADMPAVYRQADVFVLPSQNEGMSIALLEAMATGLPVIVTAVGGTKELVTPGENGLVVPWADPGALAEALRLLVDDGVRRRTMGESSRRTSLHYGWPEITKTTLLLLEEAIKLNLSGRR